MMRLVMLGVLLGLSFGVHARDWVSPIDEKYAEKNPELFSQFDQARSLVDAYAGQTSMLREAGTLLSSVVDTDPEFAPAYRELGRLFIVQGHISYRRFKNGSLSAAEEAILMSLKIEPEYADSYVLLGHLYTQMRRYEEASEALQTAETIGSGSPWLALNWAELHRLVGNYQAAIPLYQRVVDSDTSNEKARAAALSGVTTMHIVQGQLDAANLGYQKQIQFRPDDAWTWGNYSGFLLRYYEDVDGAIDAGRKAIELMDYSAGRYALGSALYTKWAMLKDDPNLAAEAQRYFDEAYSIYPYLDNVVDRTYQNPYTQITAFALTNWMAVQADKAEMERQGLYLYGQEASGKN